MTATYPRAETDPAFAATGATDAEVAEALAVYQDVIPPRWAINAAGQSGYAMIYQNGRIEVNGVNSSVAAFRLDPADMPTIAGKTKRLRLRAFLQTNAVAPGITLTYWLAPVTGVGGGSGVGPTITAIGGVMMTCVFVAPAATAFAAPVTAEIDYPAAGAYVVGYTMSAAFPTGSFVTGTVALDRRYI